jgi:hypothetical protein
MLTLKILSFTGKMLGRSLIRWWYTPVILALKRQRKEDGRLDASLCSITRTYLNNSPPQVKKE